MSLFVDLPGSFVKANPYYDYCGNEICFCLPYASGDVVAFQLGYTAATLASIGVSEADALAFCQWRDTSTLTQGTKNTTLDVFRFTTPAVSSPYDTQKYLDFYYGGPNLITAGTAGSFEANDTGTNATRTNAQARAGTWSGTRQIQALSTSTTFTFNSFSVTSGQGYWVRFSLRYDDLGGSTTLSRAIAASITGVTGTLTPVSTPSVTEDTWLDFSYFFTATQTGTANLDISFSFAYDGASPSPGTPMFDVWTDEVKVQGVTLDSTVCFVPARECLSGVLKYRHQSNAYGFDYQTDTAFYNRCRLPLAFTSYRAESDEKIVDQPDGSQLLTSARLAKIYDLEFDEMPDALLEALAIATKHSDTQVNDVPYRLSTPEIEAQPNRKYPLRAAVCEARANNYNQQASYL